MGSSVRRFLRRVTGTEAVVRNVAEQLGSERQLIQVQAEDLHARTRQRIERLDQELRALLSDTSERNRLNDERLERAIELLESRAQAVSEWVEAALAVVTQATGTPLPSEGGGGAGIDPQTADHLDRHGVFCVGSARSGTTILMLCLNESPRVHVVGECNSYRHRPGQDFRRIYNQRMADAANPPFKGAWLPDLGVSPMEPRRYFAALSKLFEFVGEKIALGPETGLAHYANAALEWQSRHYFRSAHFCTIREPRACVWSMCKMFPQIDRRHICRTWLVTAGLILDIYRNFPRAYVIFNESFDARTIERIGTVLGVEFELPPGMITEKHVHTRLEGGKLPDALVDIEIDLKDLDGLYQEMRACFDPESLRADESRYLGPVLTELRRRIDRTAQVFDERDLAGLVGPARPPAEVGRNGTEGVREPDRRPQPKE